MARRTFTLLLPCAGDPAFVSGGERDSRSRTGEGAATVSLVSTCHLTQSQSSFCVMRTSKILSLSNSQLCSAVFLPQSECLPLRVHRLLSLYPEVCTFEPPSPHLLPLATTRVFSASVRWGVRAWIPHRTEIVDGCPACWRTWLLYRMLQ